MMAFGTELQGKASHDALLAIQDHEVRIFENIKKCLTHRIKCDRDYATALDGFVAIAHKLGSVEFMTPCAQAWSTIIKETGALAQLFRENSLRLCTDTLEKIVQALADKRAARKNYFDERMRLDSELNRLQEEVTKSHANYEHRAIKLQQNKTKYEDVSKRAKTSGVRLDEVRNKYIASHAKFHNSHNEYLLAVTEANAFQQQYSRVALPALLDLQQSVQESLVLKSKEILDEYVRLTDGTAEKFVNLNESMRSSTDVIDMKKEYREFVEQNRTEPVSFQEFQFESKVDVSLASAECADEIILDSLTLDNIKQRRILYTDQLDRCRQRIESKRNELAVVEQQLVTAQSAAAAAATSHGNSTDQESHNLQSRSVSSTEQLLLRLKIQTMKRELLEQHGEEERLSALLNLLTEPMDRLADQEPPPGLPDDIDCNLVHYEGSALKNSTAGSTGSSSNSSSTVLHSALSSVRTTFSRIKPGRRSNNRFAQPPTPPTKDFDHNCGDTVSNPSGSLQRGTNGDMERGRQLFRPPVASKPAANNYQSPEDFPKLAESRAVGLEVESGRELDDEEWFHGVLPREEVQRLLVNDGDYLVRSSKNRKTGEVQYVLSVMWSIHRHFIIQNSEDGWRFEGESFPTIQELIYNQHNSQEPVTRKSEAIIKTPILRQDWELRNDDIQLHNKIGCGQFGEVFRGTFKLDDQEVAVKTCRETLSDEIKKKFLQEGRILKQYNHPNIVRFIGIATQRHPVMIVMEYISGGSLLIFLRKQGSKLSLKEIVKLCENAAAGMSYLESKNCLHRDLAARNCLVGTENIVKISDFGMSREEQEYVVSGGLKQIPIKWTAPEALNYGTYTSACDVWSFGILMWEIFSLGKSPYADMTNSQARERVDEGYRMEAPEKTPETAYRLMMQCWEAESRDRPRFSAIHVELCRIYESL